MEQTERRVILRLTDRRADAIPENAFKVFQVKNSLEWPVGSFLTEVEVQGILTDRPEVEVSIRAAVV